jgi:hypothetical protein
VKIEKNDLRLVVDIHSVVLLANMWGQSAPGARRRAIAVPQWPPSVPAFGLGQARSGKARGGVPTNGGMWSPDVPVGGGGGSGGVGDSDPIDEPHTDDDFQVAATLYGGDLPAVVPDTNAPAMHWPSTSGFNHLGLRHAGGLERSHGTVPLGGGTFSAAHTSFTPIIRLLPLQQNAVRTMHPCPGHHGHMAHAVAKTVALAGRSGTDCTSVGPPLLCESQRYDQQWCSRRAKLTRLCDAREQPTKSGLWTSLCSKTTRVPSSALSGRMVRRASTCYRSTIIMM